MKSKNPDFHTFEQNSANADESLGFDAKILRLVKGTRERTAIKSGQVDAILDPVSGYVILLPDAQAAVLEHKARFRSLVELASDGYWEQDEHYRFVSHSGVIIRNASAGNEGILGERLWDLQFDNSDEVDWSTHRTQLEWRAVFRDLELRCVDRAGKIRIISLSGEPIFDSGDRFTGYRGITRDITALKQSNLDAPESNHFARATLDALATQVCVLDAAGTIITANTAWSAFAATHRGLGAGVSVGSNYLARCDAIIGIERMEAAAMAAGIRQVIAGEREIFRYEYFCDPLSGPRWFNVTVTRLRSLGAAQVVVSYDDITDIKHAEQLLKLEYTVARCLADGGNASVALKAVIRAVCATQQWDCGRYFRLDPAAGVLSLHESWGLPVAAVEQFIEKSHGVIFRLGTGLAGRVCQSGQPSWILSSAKNTRASQTALAHETGLEGAFAFPVIADGKTIGVLAFASHTVLEPDERLLQAIRSIGHQIGQFLLRCQADDTLRQSEARFRRLTEISSDWVWEQDCDFRFTKVVGGGILGSAHILGQSLWEPSAQVILSDAAWIEHKSQLAERWSFYDFEYAVVQKDGQLSYFYISGEPMYDEAGVFTGYQGTGIDITHRKRAELALRGASL